MSDDRSQMMFDILLKIQSDLGLIKREQVLQGLRLSLIEHNIRGLTAPSRPNFAPSGMK